MVNGKRNISHAENNNLWLADIYFVYKYIDYIF